MFRLLAAGGLAGWEHSAPPCSPLLPQHPESRTLRESEFLHLTCDFSRKLKPVHRKGRNPVYVIRGVYEDFIIWQDIK